MSDDETIPQNSKEYRESSQSHQNFRQIRLLDGKVTTFEEDNEVKAVSTSFNEIKHRIGVRGGILNKKKAEPEKESDLFNI